MRLSGPSCDSTTPYLARNGSTNAAALVDLICGWAGHQVSVRRADAVQQISPWVDVVRLVAFLVCVVDRRRSCGLAPSARRMQPGSHRTCVGASIPSSADVVGRLAHGNRVMAPRSRHEHVRDHLIVGGRHKPWQHHGQPERGGGRADDEQPIHGISQ